MAVMKALVYYVEDFVEKCFKAYSSIWFVFLEQNLITIYICTPEKPHIKLVFRYTITI